MNWPAPCVQRSLPLRHPASNIEGSGSNTGGGNDPGGDARDGEHANGVAIKKTMSYRSERKNAITANQAIFSRLALSRCTDQFLVLTEFRIAGIYALARTDT